MVCEYGMSDLGPLTYGKKEQEVFLGRDIAQMRDYSDDTAKQIDVAVRAFVDEGYRSAYKILEENADIMHRMAAALLERETLDRVEIDLIIAGKEAAALQVAPGLRRPRPRRRPEGHSSPRQAASRATAKAAQPRVDPFQSRKNMRRPSGRSCL